MAASFTLRDGERLIRFGPGAVGEAPRLLADAGFHGYALLSTARALASDVAGAAAVVLEVPPGPVPEAAAAVRAGVGRRPLVAFGGGRVIDAAKAIAAADDLRVAAIPTTLSGAPFTPFHRMPAGVAGVRSVRPAVALCEPALMASQPMPALAASAMNAFAHGAESLYAPGANPVAELAALRAAELFRAALGPEQPVRDALALASLLAGYAIGTTGLWIHHALCQTVVRAIGTPHAETNAVMVPHTLRFMASRAPAPLGGLALALGADRPDPGLVADRVAALAARAGVTRLADLGVDRRSLPELARATRGHRAFAGGDGRPSEEELVELLGAAL